MTFSIISGWSQENIPIPPGQSIICVLCRYKEVKFTEVSAPCLESFKTIDNTLGSLGGRIDENIDEQISVSKDCSDLTSAMLYAMYVSFC